ncbi:MAG: molybdopterin-containing oxidoreductase family protein [Dehalococcoidia bacterium]
MTTGSVNGVRRTVKTMCPMNCNPTYCGMEVELEGDQVLSIRGDKENPDSRGFLCIRGQASKEIIDNPRRIVQPRTRAERGSNDWRDTSWDEALGSIAAAIRRAGPESVALYHAHGLIPNTVHRQLAQRFTNIGGFQWWNPATICWGLGAFGLSLTGPLEVNTKEDLAAHSELVILWGANLVSQPTTVPHIVAAKKRGARIVAIDVRQSEAFDLAHVGHLLKPGSDAALALAMIHVIIADGLQDKEFVSAHTVGFEELAASVRTCTPEWAEGETGIAAPTIRSLARLYAATKQSMIVLGGSSMHKSANGWQGGRAISCLPGLTGAIGQPGGGFGPRHAAETHGMGFGDVRAADRRPAGDYLISEMSTVLEQLEAGRIKVLLLFGTNMLSSWSDTTRLARALERMDCVVSHDLFMNDTARGFADIVLPGTSWLEETGYKVTNTNLYLMDQAIPARGEARSAAWVMTELAERLGLDDFFPWENMDALLDTVFDHPSTGHVTAAQLRAQKGQQPLAVSHIAHPDLNFPTPSGKIEFYSQKAVELGLPPLPVYAPSDEIAPKEEGRRERYPLIFRQGRSITHFHAFYDHGQALPSLARADPEPQLWINPADAGARGLQDGGRIRMFNDRGEMSARALVTEKVQPGVVWMRDGWLGINFLTSGARSVPDAAARAFPAGQASYEARIEVAAEEVGSRA